MANLYDFDFSRLRKGQQAALDVIFDRIKMREPYTAIVIPTRYGKSDLMRASAIQLHKHGVIGVAFGVSPGTALTAQLNEQAKWIQCVERYDLPRTASRRIVDRREDNYSSNGECFRCVTLQFVICHIDHFVAKAAAMKASGKPALFFIDECHFTSDRNRWGDAAEKLANAGALIVLLTATALRNDGHPPKGFRSERKVIQSDVTRKMPGKGSSPDKVKIDVYKGQEIETCIIADHETTFGAAWEESPSPLCKVDFSGFDVYLSETEAGPVEGEDESEWAEARISTMSASQTRQYLGRICRSPSVISEGARRLARLLTERRREDPTVAAIVFCDCDRATDDGEFVINRWAKMIRKAIESAPDGKALNVVIATTAGDDDSDVKADSLISKFVHGSGDVLIVKQMGGAGLDCPRIKIVLDLSPVRAVPSWIQRIMRAATPHNGHKVCTLITPDDCLARACFDRMIASQGGAASFEGDLITSYEVERQERQWLNVVGTANADFRDNAGNLGLAEQYEDVRSVREILPELHVLTDAELAQRVLGLFDKVRSRKGRVANIEGDLADTKTNCNELAAEIAHHRMGGKYNRDQYEPIIRTVWQEAHRRAGTMPPLENITELRILQRVQAALIEILRSETGAA